MMADDNILSLNGYTVLKLKLASQPSFQEPAWHHLYFRRHEPKFPGPDDDRTLFTVNVPIDATEVHFRSLFGKLAGSRVETVQFGSAGSPDESANHAKQIARFQHKKKRKRDQVDDTEEKGDLPETWDRVLRRSGSTALIVFVDRAGLSASLKAAQRGKGKTLVWGEGIEQDVPVLGSHRKIVLSSGHTMYDVNATLMPLRKATTCITAFDILRQCRFKPPSTPS